MFQVVTSNGASRSAKRLPKHYKTRLVELLLTLRENPAPSEYYDLKKLKGEEDTYRARLGDIRVVYEVNWREKRISILLVEYRGRAYS